MNYKRLDFVSSVLAVVVFGNSCVPRRGDHILETWETTNQIFKLRVRQYDEKASIILPHYYYTFETCAPDSDEWHEIAIVRTDDDVAIPREQVRSVNDHTGYIFMGHIYAVTVDGGRTWSIWDAAREYGKNGFIKEVKISADGIGVMIFHPGPQQREIPQLHTKDYGSGDFNINRMRLAG